MQTKKILVIISLFIFIVFSCDDDAEINLQNTIQQATPNFQLDFDGQTWVADAIVTTVVNNKIIINATQNNGEQKVVLTLNTDQVGAYPLSANTELGSVGFDANITDEISAFLTKEDELSGRIDLDAIDTVTQLLTGKFFFTGKRLVQQFGPLGVPILDINNNLVFAEESKIFTNGIFENIFYSTIPIIDPEPTDENEFFVNIGNVEFIDTTLSAIKVNEVIRIRATKANSNEIIELKMPENITAGSTILLDVAVDPTTDSSATYDILSANQTFANLDPLDITNNELTIISHHQTTNKIVGTFKFIALDITGGTNSFIFKDGTFSVVYEE